MIEKSKTRHSLVFSVPSRSKNLVTELKNYKKLHQSSMVKIFYTTNILRNLSFKPQVLQQVQ